MTTDAPDCIAMRWEPGAAVTSGQLMTHPEYTQYRRADLCFTADDLIDRVKGSRDRCRLGTTGHLDRLVLPRIEKMK